MLADGEYLTTTSVSVLKAIGFEEGGTSPTEVLLDQIARTECKHALERAFKILDYRERSIHQLRDSLLSDGYGVASVESVVARLVDLELVSDTRFAELFVRSKRSTGWGGRRIANGLRQAGVPDDLAVASLLEDEPESEYERALVFALRKRPLTETAQRRLVDALARRGFSFDVARRAAAEAFERATSD
ncbi:MAG: regulatory protein RecX [Coriobacteriia bacterium]